MPDIRLAQTSWEWVDTLKRVWDLRVNYVPIRIALGRSLLSGDLPNCNEHLPEGRSIDTQQILSAGESDYAPLFRALIVQRHGRILDDAEFLILLKGHIDHGFSLIKQDCAAFKSTDDYVDYLVELTQRGLNDRTLEAHSTSDALSSFTRSLNLTLGEEVNTREPICLELNKTPNAHIAVIGKSTNVKLRFVKNLLTQARQRSDFIVNFIFFDFHGDVANDEGFIKATRSQVIHLSTETLPLNPFSRVNIASEAAMKRAAKEFADIARSLERNIGTAQWQILHDSIYTAFRKRRFKTPSFPDIYSITEEIEATYFKAHRKPDTLIDTVRRLVDLEIFAHADADELWSSLINKTIIIDLHDLDAAPDLAVHLILDSIHRELLMMPSAEIIEDVHPMRTMIVLSEAQNYLGDKRQSLALQESLEKIGDKGASMLLMTQSADYYDKSAFDFASLLKFIFVFRTNANSSKFIQKTFGISSRDMQTFLKKIARMPADQVFAKSPNGDRAERFLLVKLDDLEDTSSVCVKDFAAISA